MKVTMVNIAEGKKWFSRLIQDAATKKEEVVVMKRGKPVAVIVPFEEYEQTKRLEGYRKIMEARAALEKAGISAESVWKESKVDLERRP